ncbi:MAG: GDSL-type esterase/lipase family protein [Ignavibacteriales bacterium]|nr:GDSL-type esterase/lipase family protein [Ignavibacteriales bacterium]
MKNLKQKKYPKWFYLVLILIPIFLLIVLELSLRLFNYGIDQRQWIEINENQITLNNYIAKRYFHSTLNAPLVLSSSFLKEKKKNAFRVFVVGESSAAGFPYLPNGSFSNYIEDRLRLLYPEAQIEVINCGITATNSYTWLDLFPGILDQKPDLIIFYGGHNEYYGALGVASTESFGSSRWLIKFSLWVDKFKTTELLRNTIKWISSIFTKKSFTNQSNSTLMAKLAKGQYVPLNSELFNKGVKQFEDNLREMLQLAKANNINVVLASLVSNLKDQKPFVSKNQANIAGADSIYEKAIAELKSGKQNNADSLFRLAKDLDLLRFRAPEKFNLTINKLAKEFNYPVANIDSLFASVSSNKIVGNNLMTDHLHPNLFGYQLMGKKIFEVLEQNKYLPNAIPQNIPQEKQDSIVKAEFNFSKIDTLIALYRIRILKNDWPYVEDVNEQNLNRIKLSNIYDSLAYFVASGSLGWGNSHKILADKFLREKNFTAYKKEMSILINTFPYQVEYCDNLIDLLIKNKLYEEAYPFLLIRYNQSPNAFSTKWLGYVNFSRKNNKQAIQYFEKSLLYSHLDAEVYFYLTGAYGRDAKFDKALDAIKKCLELNPDYPNGRAVLQLAQNEVKKRK